MNRKRVKPGLDNQRVSVIDFVPCHHSSPVVTRQKLEINSMRRETRQTSKATDVA